MGDLDETLIPRRRVLLLLGAGVVAAGGGLGVLLEACAPAAPITVRVQFDTSTLVTGTPTEVPFTITEGSASVAGSTWLVKRADGGLTAFDPRCTHELCRYDWAADAGRFKCRCHNGVFALDGSVLTGPPPRPLDRFPARVTGTVLELDVPASFATPRQSI